MSHGDASPGYTEPRHARVSVRELGGLCTDRLLFDWCVAHACGSARAPSGPGGLQTDLNVGANVLIEVVSLAALC